MLLIMVLSTSVDDWIHIDIYRGAIGLLDYSYSCRPSCKIAGAFTQRNMIAILWIML